ncbi:rhomboid family intramembrane serine protease [Gordonia jinhuaensis]
MNATGARSNVSARSPMTVGLIAVNVVVYVICVMQAHSAGSLQTSRLFFDMVLFKPFVADGEYWRLVTAGFLHFSVTHIAMNMISLYILGRDLERVVGMARYLAVYLAALLGGSAAVMWFAGDNTVNAGASGAIYGLMGAALILVITNGLSVRPVVTLIVINLVISVTIPGISLWAHLGGLVFGAAATAAIVVLPRALPAQRRTQAMVTRVGWVGLVALIVIAFALGVFSPATV